MRMLVPFYTVLKNLGTEIKIDNPNLNIDPVAPDVYKICTDTFMEILDEYHIEKPYYVKELTLNEFRYDKNIVEKNEMEKIVRNLKHNISMFTIVKKDNVVEYVPGDRTYMAQNVAKLLPNLDATVSGVKVIIDIDIFEKFFGGRFEFNILNKLTGFKFKEKT